MANPPTDYFWSFFWTIPDDFPTGSLGYKVHATMNNGERVTWEPFTRPATQLTVIAASPRWCRPGRSLLKALNRLICRKGRP